MMKKLFRYLLLCCLLAACSPATGPAESNATPAEATWTITTPSRTQTTLPPTPTITLSPTITPTVTQTPPPSPTPEPTARRGGTISIFCLTVTQAIEGIEPPPAEPISETIGRVLAGAGMNFVPDSDACDAVLKLDLTFIPQSYQYQLENGSGTTTCFTGAALIGTADLTFLGSSMYHRDLRGEYVPAGSTSVCPEPGEAPFERVWPAAAMTALTEIWGKNAMVPALSDPFRSVREAGAESLHLLSVEEILSILPFLSTTLEDESEVVRLRALEALQRIILVEVGPVAELTPELLALLAVEQHPEASQRAVDLLVRIARQDDSRQGEIVTGLRQVLEDSQPYPEAGIPNLTVLNGIADLGPLALKTAPALIALLEGAEDPRYTQNILLALRGISGQDYGLDAAQWQTWWERQ